MIPNRNLPNSSRKWAKYVEEHPSTGASRALLSNQLRARMASTSAAAALSATTALTENQEDMRNFLDDLSRGVSTATLTALDSNKWETRDPTAEDVPMNDTAVWYVMNPNNTIARWWSWTPATYSDAGEVITAGYWEKQEWNSDSIADNAIDWGKFSSDLNSELQNNLDTVDQLTTVTIPAIDAKADAAATAGEQAKADALAAMTKATTAEADAAAAQATALGAQSAADAAGAKATTASGLVTVASANPTSADASGKPVNAIWEVRSGATVLRRYVLTSPALGVWTQVKLGQDFIGDDAIGRAQIGEAAVGTAEVADLAVTNAKIGDLTVAKLTATQGAEFPISVVNTLVGQDAFITAVYANRIVVAPENPVVNSTFTQGTKGWTLRESNIVTVTDGPKGVSAPVLRITPVSADLAAAINQGFPYSTSDDANSYHPAVGTSWRCTMTVRLVSGTAGVIRVRGWISKGDNSSANRQWPLLTQDLKASTATAGQWVTLEGTYTFPAGWSRFGLAVHSLNAVGTVWEVGEVTLRPMVGTTTIEDGAVTTDKMVANSISGDRITTNTLAGNKIVANTITAAQIQANAVTTVSMQANTINGDRILTNTLLANKIVANSITSAQIAANTLTANEIASNAIQSRHIIANAVTATQIAANAVTTNSLQADAINGMTITGATIQTAATGNRTVMDSSGLHVYGSSGVEQVRVGQTADNGIAVRNPNTGVLQGLSPFVFGSKTPYINNPLQLTVIGNAYTWGNYTSEWLTDTFIAQSSQYFILFSANFTAGNNQFPGHMVYEFPVDVMYPPYGTSNYIRPFKLTAIWDGYYTSGTGLYGNGNPQAIGMGVVSVTPGQEYRVRYSARVSFDDYNSTMWAYVGQRAALIMPI